MMLNMLSPELVDSLLRERLQQAARDALAHQAASAASRSDSLANLRSSPGRARLWLASSLRTVAVRLDPSLGCEPCLAGASNSR